MHFNFYILIDPGKREDKIRVLWNKWRLWVPHSLLFDEQRVPFPEWSGRSVKLTLLLQKLRMRWAVRPFPCVFVPWQLCLSLLLPHIYTCTRFSEDGDGVFLVPMSALKIIYHTFFTRLWFTELYSEKTRRIIPQLLAYKKKAIRIIEGCENRVSCRNLLNKLKMLPLTSNVYYLY